MLHAILCYNSEETVFSWTREEDAAVMARLAVVQERLAREGKLGPSLRLQPTKTAATLRKGKEPYVTDGPFAETKEAILGFYVVDVASTEEALEIARELTEANPGPGAYEVRPIGYFHAGGAVR